MLKRRKKFHRPWWRNRDRQPLFLKIKKEAEEKAFGAVLSSFLSYPFILLFFF